MHVSYADVCRKDAVSNWPVVSIVNDGKKAQYRVKYSPLFNSEATKWTPQRHPVLNMEQARTTRTTGSP